MNRIEKTLKKLSKRERGLTIEILENLKTQNLEHLNIKKLKGREDIFRIRKGKIRVIFRKIDTDIFVLAIERRSEKTYENI